MIFFEKFSDWRPGNSAKGDSWVITRSGPIRLMPLVEAEHSIQRWTVICHGLHETPRSGWPSELWRHRRALLCGHWERRA
jgi:hypothetical protein